mmetsp:Transcript_55997/g.109611  ORF Transcript_55997/g.109611 Transcript_55997/m.109611 type:complete len:245 (-) Transcript_55997:732-1466(-)
MARSWCSRTGAIPCSPSQTFPNNWKRRSSKLARSPASSARKPKLRSSSALRSTEGGGGACIAGLGSGAMPGLVCVSWVPPGFSKGVWVCVPAGLRADELRGGASAEELRGTLAVPLSDAATAGGCGGSQGEGGRSVVTAGGGPPWSIRRIFFPAKSPPVSSAPGPVPTDGAGSASEGAPLGRLVGTIGAKPGGAEGDRVTDWPFPLSTAWIASSCGGTGAVGAATTAGAGGTTGVGTTGAGGGD